MSGCHEGALCTVDFKSKGVGHDKGGRIQVLPGLSFMHMHGQSEALQTGDSMIVISSLDTGAGSS